MIVFLPATVKAGKSSNDRMEITRRTQWSSEHTLVRSPVRNRPLKMTRERINETLSLRAEKKQNRRKKKIRESKLNRTDRKTWDTKDLPDVVDGIKT